MGDRLDSAKNAKKNSESKGKNIDRHKPDKLGSIDLVASDY